MKNLLLALLSFALILTVPMGAWSQRLSGLPFSPAKKAGDTLHVSGQISVSPEGERIDASVADETRQVMENIGRILKENGYGYEDIVSVTVYLSDMKDYQAMNSAYAAFFGGDFPARACVGGLQIGAGLHVEISAIAYKDAG